ncbi:MAG TPA: Holliday junction branch migration protein RuvA [Steroidobacteraceae bacterium]|nr:Holliday junction branch migration protein RuvA [Steroidobacteraceae bacterium]
MIGALRGLLAEKEPQRLLVEVQGVGYEVEVPMSTFLALPPAGAAVRLRVHHVLREDASLLYGFNTEEERALFRALLRVTGVGPRMALSILSGMSADAFEGAIAGDDAASLTRIPGVGRKTAERLVVEMRDHFRNGTRVKSAAGAARTPREEALDALLALGYKPAEASRLLESAGETADTTEGLLRAALQGAVR